MDTINVEKFYSVLLESSLLIKEGLDSTFIEALIETGENIIDDGTVHVENGLPTAETQQQLTDIYSRIDYRTLSAEDRKQAIQLILIKAAKEDLLQPNHQPTPDAIGVLFSYLIDLFYSFDQPAHIADFSVGTGNLLYTLYTSLHSADRKLVFTGVENDDLLISLTSTLSALMDMPIELMHQDALKPLLIDPVDIMVSDLPVGYYPMELKDDAFKTAIKEGQSYSHFLLIEQGLNYLKDNGLAFYLLPTSTFEAVEVKSLLSHIQSVGHVQGIIHLPSEWFKNEQSKKSILIAQKKGDKSIQAKEVLIATSPSLSNKEAFKTFLSDITNWKSEQGIH
ncbi:class I SAM-dependent methyltransferase [Alkalibacterium olivapovliticus]|uniref:Site-specific DNA-methyltransferase (Adenine-specific) n=1 Tax=Alkalibacterium olivapovliticus TaxID=99907 RepID=A0A2T0WBL6_9LACT|nr:class I SAM-dependent methyltransferase [Alkalibacterium olivapovliticus]PRY83914.1 site-specific DNA-methyltransferase (adenine-specific) [Alkalibacterium olivapovliticus]